MAGPVPAASATIEPPDFAEDYAAFSSRLTVADLPAEAVTAAKINLLDTLACAAAGHSAAGVAEVSDLVLSWAGAPQARVLCAGDRVPAHHAAWLNGVMAHARDYDDTHDGAVLHAGVSVVPAALAAADLNPQATGADLLAGIATGLELICRLGVATRIGIIDSGFIYSSLFGYFGATAAAARVLGLDAEQTVNALGIAYSQAAGTHQVTRDAALTKRMQPGFAAKAALVSVELARRGVRGARHAFEGVDGLFRTYLRDRFDPDALREGLGRRFEFVELSYKPYPCCRFNHTAIDAALQIAAQERLAAERIRRIVVGVNRQAFEAVCTPVEVRRAPKTIVQAQFSIPYTVATALIHGRVGLAAFTEEGLGDVGVLALAARVETRIDAEIDRDWPRSISPAVVDVESENGAWSRRVDHPRGHPANPMTATDFTAKLADCLRASGLTWPSETADHLQALVLGLERLPRGAAVVDPLCRQVGNGA